MLLAHTPPAIKIPMQQARAPESKMQILVSDLMRERRALEVLGNPKGTDEEKGAVLDSLVANPIPNRVLADACWKIHQTTENQKLSEKGLLAGAAISSSLGDGRRLQTAIPYLIRDAFSVTSRVELCGILSNTSCAISRSFQESITFHTNTLLTGDATPSDLRVAVTKLCKAMPFPDDTTFELLENSLCTNGKTARTISERLAALDTLTELVRISPDPRNSSLGFFTILEEVLARNDTPQQLKIAICKLAHNPKNLGQKQLTRSQAEIITPALESNFVALCERIAQVNKNNIEEYRDDIAQFRLMVKMREVQGARSFQSSLRNIADNAQHLQLKREAKDYLNQLRK